MAASDSSHLSPTHPSSPARLLRLALRANAGFSATCGLLFVVDATALSPMLGVPTALLVVLGLGLLGFAALLVTTSRRGDTARLVTEARVHCAADLAWVVGSVPVVALGWLTPIGSIGLTGVSAVVLTLAMVQWRGMVRAATADA